MKSYPSAFMLSSTKAAFPTTVRHAVHDITQPLQALHMFLGLPGVVVNDHRGLPQKVTAALNEVDLQLTQLHRLSHLIDGDDSDTCQLRCFSETLAFAQQISPDLWNRDQKLRVYAQNSQICLPCRNAAWVINALLENAWSMRPKTRVVVGARTYKQWVIIADDGDGLTDTFAADLEETLNGASKLPLKSGLLLARLLVSSWNGRWRVISKPGKGSVFAFSVPEGCIS